MNREDRLMNNLRNANQLLGEFVSDRNNLEGYYGHLAIFLDYNKLCSIIDMISDYIGYIHMDLRQEIDKRYIDHDQIALMKIAEHLSEQGIIAPDHPDEEYLKEENNDGE